MLTLHEVTKAYPQGGHRVHALRGVSLSIQDSEFVSLMEPSGSGKSTLLHLLGALDVPTAGSITFAGRNLKTLSECKRALLRRSRMQGVAIARALVTDPELILCDEPTGNLDSANAREALALMRSLPDGRRTVVRVTHDPQAAAFGDRTIHLRDGRLDASGGRHAVAA